MTSENVAADIQAAEAHLQAAAASLEGSEDAEAALTEIATINTRLVDLLDLLPAEVES